MFCLVTIAFSLLRCLVSWVVRADQVCCALGEHLCCELLAEPDGVVERTGSGSSYGEGAVGGQRDCSDPQFVTEVPFRNFGQRADRRRAAGLELGEQRALGLDAGAGVRVVEGVVRLRRRRSLSARHSTARAPWPGRREHLERVEHLGGLVDPAEAGQSGPGEHDGVELAGGDLAQPGVHVAAYADQLDAEPERLRSGRPGAGRRCRRGSRRGARRG